MDDLSEYDLDLYVPHSPDCRCSRCKPEEHGPEREHWQQIDVGEEVYIAKEGWLFE